MGEEKALLFVYGTLLKGLNHPVGRILGRYADFVGLGTFQGRLYDLGSYPGAVASEKSGEIVRGEVYAIRQTEQLFRILDRYEGPQFRREKVTVSLEDGEEVDAWVYLYNSSTHGLKLIPSGDYLTAH